MNRFIDQVRQLIARVMGQTPGTDRQKEEIVRVILDALRDTQEKELSCDEVFEVIDRYAEAIVKGQAPEHLMPLVNHHLTMCGECREELEMLLEMIQLQTA